MTESSQQLQKIAQTLEKIYDFISMKDSENSPSTADGATYRHRLNYGGYIMEKIVDGRLCLIYEDESQDNRVELRPK